MSKNEDENGVKSAGIRQNSRRQAAIIEPYLQNGGKYEIHSLCGSSVYPPVFSELDSFVPRLFSAAVSAGLPTAAVEAGRIVQTDSGCGPAGLPILLCFSAARSSGMDEKDSDFYRKSDDSFPGAEYSLDWSPGPHGTDVRLLRVSAGRDSLCSSGDGNHGKDQSSSDGRYNGGSGGIHSVFPGETAASGQLPGGEGCACAGGCEGGSRCADRQR